MTRAILIIIAAVLVACAMLQIRAERNRRVYWRGIERVIEQRAAETLAAQELAINALKEATNQMHQANAAAKTETIRPDMLSPWTTYAFFDDRTNLVLTVIHTNGTWIAVPSAKPRPAR